jgi:hypothetical protein
MGNRDCWDDFGASRFIALMNERFGEYAREHSGFYINDLAYTAAAYGLDAWHDMQVWYMYKIAMSLDAVPSVAFSVSRIVKSIFGKNKK